MAFFFARISESAEVQRLLRAESFALIAGPRGVGTTALLSHEYSRWQGIKHFVPAHAHDGGEAEVLSAMQRALGVDPDGDSVLPKRVTLFAKTLKRLDSSEATFLAVDNVPESSILWLRSLAKEVPWLHIAASMTLKPAEPLPSDAVVLPPFSTVQRDVRGPSEAAAFVMGALRAASPLWIEGRSDSAMVEEVVEVLGGNALLLSRLVSVAVDRGFAYVLEKVRTRALVEVTDVLVKDVREHLSEESKATVEFVAILPATIGHQTLRSIFVGVSSQKPHAWDDTFATLCARSLLVLDAVGRVTVPSEFRSRAESYSNLQPRLEDAARGLIHEYASFDSRLAKDLGRAVATFRYDQGLLRWVALTLADRTLAVQVAIILARFAVYSADDQTLSVLLRSSENLEPALRVEALFALAEAYRAVGKPDRADPVVEELLRLEDPRAQATGLITRTRLRWKRNDFQGAQGDISAALKLRAHLREPELVRALLGRAIISMSICEFENASREFRAALEFVDERGLVHDRAEVLAWMAHSAVVRLELDEADVLLRELDEVLKHVPSIYARIEGASCRSMLQIFRMDLQGAAVELHRAVRIAQQAGLRHSELDLHLDRALVCLLAFDLDGHESALFEIGEIAADWAAPARVLAELAKHRLAQRLIRKEIEPGFFIEEVVKIENAATPGAIFALMVLLGTTTLTEVVQANRASIARLQECALALGSERDVYTRGFFLMLHRVAKAAEPRLGIPWPVSPRAAGTLWVSVTASYFAFDDGESDLGTKPQLHTILRKLANERNLRPGIPVSSEELTQCVWPGEKMLAKASKNRLHVAIVKLRGLGLSKVLLSQDGGYLLDPGIPTLRVFDP